VGELEAPYMNRKSLKNLAILFRRMFQLGNEPYLDVLGILENCDVKNRWRQSLFLWSEAMKRHSAYVVIYRPWITVKGRRIYAWQYGKKAFRLVIPSDKYHP